MRFPALRRDPFRGEVEDRSRLVPTSARAVGWFWLAGVPIGFVAGVVEFIRTLQGGDLSIALPAGVGISGWALGRGLLRGSRRAWRWTRRIAGLLMFASVLLGVATMFADPESLTMEMPWGVREAERWQAMLFLALLAGIGAWQFFSLNSQAARAAFNLPPDGAATDDE